MLLLIIPSTTFGIDLVPDSQTVIILQEIQERLYNDEFEKALSLSNDIIRQNPEDPIGYLFHAISLLAVMFDSEENSETDNFNRDIDSTLAKASRVLDSCTDCQPRLRAWMYLALGHARAYRSLWEARFGSKVRAIKGGRAAAAEYEQGLRIDSTLYDLYFGLGLYHYWKSAKAGVLRWLHIIKDDKDKGIQELRLAADSSIISRNAARSALVWVWLDSKQYDSVIIVTQNLCNRYPEGKSFLWPLAQAYYDRQEYRKAVETYIRLRDRLQENPGNYYNLIECDYKIYDCYEKMSLDEKARQVAVSVHEYGQQVPKETRKRQQKKLMFLIRQSS